jgi:site-specific recombinase XerD
MGRNLKPLFKDQVSGSWFCRFYDDDKQYRLSLNTKDEAEALKRYSVVQKSRMSWNQFNKTLQGLNTLIVNAVDDHKIVPGITMSASKEALSKLISHAVSTGQANFDADRAFWLVRALSNGVPTDSTALPAPFAPMPSGSGLIQAFNSLKSVAIIDNWSEIDNFYRVTMAQIFLDKARVKFTGVLWLNYLEENNIKSWNQITEELLIQFKDYRKSTTLSRGRNSKVAGRTPSNNTLNRDIQFLRKSFDEAIARGCMTVNPVRNWKPEVHIAPIKKPLSLGELKQIFDKLTGTVRDIVILLFCSCKRRKEILTLQIDDVNFNEHYISYTEFKNKSRTDAIHKAFFMTASMETFLRRSIGNRTSGSLWPEKYHPDFISHKFEEISSVVAPKKDATLKNLRQCATDTMERAGLSDTEIDANLGHLSVSKALKFYPDRSPEAVYKRFAERTRKGVEILSKSIDDHLK